MEDEEEAGQGDGARGERPRGGGAVVRVLVRLLRYLPRRGGRTIVLFRCPVGISLDVAVVGETLEAPFPGDDQLVVLVSLPVLLFTCRGGAFCLLPSAHCRGPLRYASW
jgi:hypothetical protein